MPLDIFVQLPLFLFEGGGKGTKCTYLVFSVWNDPHCINWTHFPPQNNNSRSFIWSFTLLKKVTMVFKPWQLSEVLLDNHPLPWALPSGLRLLAITSNFHLRQYT